MGSPALFAVHTTWQRSRPRLERAAPRLLCPNHGAGLSEGWGMVQYKSTDDVLSDVQLVWANCRRYNAAGSPIM